MSSPLRRVRVRAGPLVIFVAESIEVVTRDDGISAPLSPKGYCLFRPNHVLLTVQCWMSVQETRLEISPSLELIYMRICTLEATKPGELS